MLTLEQARADIMTLSNEDIIDYVLECQALLGIRICPVNIHKDHCVCVAPCRKNYATCWKLYFKKETGGAKC